LLERGTATGAIIADVPAEFAATLTEAEECRNLDTAHIQTDTGKIDKMRRFHKTADMSAKSENFCKTKGRG
jgi:hypothetical protein